MSDDVFNDIDGDLELTYRLDGVDRTLGDFTGVVDISDESRTYYEWRVVSMNEESGVELTAESGTVHTYSVAYFADQLEAGRYRPAISTGDGVQVASVGGESVDSGASGGQAETVETAQPVEHEADAPASQPSTDGEDATESAGPAPEESNVTVLGDADDAGADVADPGEDADAQVESTDRDAEGREESDAGGDESADDADSTPDEPQQDEVERLRAVVTDTTRHRFVRENAIRELGDYGERGAAVLASVVDDESITAEERALASVLLRDIRAETE